MTHTLHTRHSALLVRRNMASAVFMILFILTGIWGIRGFRGVTLVALVERHLQISHNKAAMAVSMLVGLLLAITLFMARPPSARKKSKA